MGFIKLTGVNFSPVPLSSKIMTIKHRLTSDPDISGSYTIDSTTVESGIDGTFTAPFYILGLLNGTSYTVEINSNCGGLAFEHVFTTACNCSAGFVANGTNTQCVKTETVAPVITHSNYCLARSQNGAYSARFARIYNPSWSNSSIALISAPVGDVFAEMTLAPYWANPTLNSTLGVMNRHAVWIDSDCDGTKNALTAGEQTTVSYEYVNTGVARRVYVLVCADNQFVLSLNGNIIAQTTVPNSQENFKIAHIFPVDIIVGINIFNVVATGDGTVNDAVCMMVFDNTASQVLYATQDSDLTILFKTDDLVGQHIDIATCEAGYSLDTTGGQGNYTCKRITYQNCNTI